MPVRDYDPEKLDLRRLDDEALSNVRVAARAFVRGNSELVTSYRAIVERTLGTIQLPIWALLSVKVASGSVLEFGPGVNVLLAFEVEIESGGLIRSRGHLTVNCTNLRKPGRSILASRVIAGSFRPIFTDG